MKRTIVATLALVLAAASASAQGLTMGTMNGWTFQFSGNVNAFLTYTSPKCSGEFNGCDFDGNIIPTAANEKVVRIGTGLAPAFAIFNAKGKEGGVDLGVHFGFAPEIQTAYRQHNDCGGGGQCGAQIDMREVYLTAGGSWGQILAGRAIGLYQKQNLLTDMTVFGYGLNGGGAIGAGTSLGHIGTGYLYANFNSQLTYSTGGNKEGQLQIGLFDPSISGAALNQVGDRTGFYDITDSPRLEAEYTWTHHTGATGSADKVMVYASGLVQALKAHITNSPTTATTSVTPWGLAGGVEFNRNNFQADLSGSYNTGLGNVALFDGLGLDAANSMRISYSYLAQLQYTLSDKKWKLGASYGANHLNQTDAEKQLTTEALVQDASSLVLSGTYMWTKSLRWVIEFTSGTVKSYDGDKASSNQGAVGMMLFF